MNSDITVNEVAKNIIQNEILCCQSSLVDDLLKREIFLIDDVVNLGEEITTEEQSEEYGLEIGDYHYPEIFEWWCVSSWLAEHLKEEGQPVLENGYGQWWGRCTTGQSIDMDGVMQRIAQKIMKH